MSVGCWKFESLFLSFSHSLRMLGVLAVRISDADARIEDRIRIVVHIRRADVGHLVLQIEVFDKVRLRFVHVDRLRVDKLRRADGVHLADDPGGRGNGQWLMANGRVRCWVFGVRCWG